MKKLTSIALLFLALANLSSADSLAEGRYLLQSDVLTSGLCDLTKSNELYRLTHLERHNTILNLKNKNHEILIVNTTLPGTEYWISISGSAVLGANDVYSGKMKAAYHAFPLIPGKVRKGIWSLRKATEKDIRDGIARGLELASELYWADRGMKNENRVEHALRGAAGNGYSTADLPRILKMFANGEISLEDNKFTLKIEDSQHAPPAGRGEAPRP